MKILLIGDIVGKKGRETIKKILRPLKKEENIDFVIANGENSSHGVGITKKVYKELMESGIDFFTLGNHAYTKIDIFETLEEKDSKIIRPANFPPNNIGMGYKIIEKNNKKLLIINLIGRVYMSHNYDCPFRKIDEILNENKNENFEAIILDFHAEATSEKISLKHYLDSKIGILFGTHTHIATADSEITNNSMAYISDIGMTGAKDSVIGAKKEAIIQSFINQNHIKIEPAYDGPAIFNALLVDIENNKAKYIKQIIKHIN